MGFIDKATSFLRDGLAFLVAKHPMRSSVGSLLGVFFIILNHVTNNLLDDKKVNPFHDLDQWLFIFLGVFVMYIPLIFTLVRSKADFDESIEAAFRAINRAEKGGMSKAQVDQAYKLLCGKVLENVEIKAANKKAKG